MKRIREVTHTGSREESKQSECNRTAWGPKVAAGGRGIEHNATEDVDLLCTVCRVGRPITSGMADIQTFLNSLAWHNLNQFKSRSLVNSVREGRAWRTTRGNHCEIICLLMDYNSSRLTDCHVRDRPSWLQDVHLHQPLILIPVPDTKRRVQGDNSGW